MEKLVLKNFTRIIRGLFSERKWQSFWAKDWVLKVISLFLATVLWYFVVGEDTVDKNVMVPVEIINLPRDLVISNQFKKEIEVTVSGPRSLIQDMIEKGMSRQINLSDATPGTSVVKNDTDSIQVPRGITVLRVQPSSIILSLDKLIQKQFKVMPVTTGDVASGFELKTLKMNPDLITITGPETILSSVEALFTKTININGMKESRQIQIPLDLNASIVDLIGETSVTADIVIKPKMVDLKISDVKVEAYVGGSKRIVTPDTVDVMARVPVLLTRKTKDIRDLFSVTAIAGDSDRQFLQVSVIPKESVELPIEIRSIIPDSVQLVVGSDSEAEGPHENNGVNEQLKEQELTLPPAGSNGREDDSSLEASESNGKGAIQIQATKTKIKHKD